MYFFLGGVSKRFRSTNLEGLVVDPWSGEGRNRGPHTGWDLFLRLMTDSRLVDLFARNGNQRGRIYRQDARDARDAKKTWRRKVSR